MSKLDEIGSELDAFLIGLAVRHGARLKSWGFTYVLNLKQPRLEGEFVLTLHKRADPPIAPDLMADNPDPGGGKVPA